jgi:4-hydroxy-tetrahydrodipicolinate synthase
MTNTLNGINFQGVWVDALTPLQENLSIDEAKLCAHIRNLCAKGVEQFVLFGQAGEGASFSSDEKLSAVSHVLASGLEAKRMTSACDAFWYLALCMDNRSRISPCLTMWTN